VLGANTGKKNHFGWPCHRHRFGEAAFGPATVIKVTLVETLPFVVAVRLRLRAAMDDSSISFVSGVGCYDRRH
jgi:hypothetical protein